MKIEVKDFVSYEDAEKRESVGARSIGGLGGWFNMDSKGERWKDFIDGWDEKSIVYLEALRDKVLADKIWRGGFWHQEEGCPVFTDGSVAQFSMRGWGDLLAAIWSEKYDTDYCYCAFAWYVEMDGPDGQKAEK